MAIPRKLILLWLSISALLALTAIMQWRAEKRLLLPVPDKPRQVHIQSGETNTTWQWQDGHWYIDGQRADSARIATWFAQLRACRGNYSPQDIAPTADPYPLLLEIDGLSYHLGAANPFSQSHYITYDQRVYLCGEAVKATLRMPVQTWLEKPDA